MGHFFLSQIGHIQTEDASIVSMTYNNACYCRMSFCVEEPCGVERVTK